MMAPLSSVVPCVVEKRNCCFISKPTGHCLQPFGSDDCLVKRLSGQIIESDNFGNGKFRLSDSMDMAEKVKSAICNLQFLGTGFTERLHMRL